MSQNSQDPYVAAAEAEYEYFERKRGLAPLKENPAVPIGAFGTLLILMGGLASFSTGNQVWSQRFMRARVVLQGATVVAAAGGAIYLTEKRKREKEQKQQQSSSSN
eukprot:c11891_g1_i1.p1 GENE.c11891_g1_i1~~c11891_g1_i1.p1  ORF type:complete len:124 (+),score=27.91 c11891_g1_i1:55-372(+)